MKIKAFFKRLWGDETGQSATEYILILAVLVAIILLLRKFMPRKMQELVEKALNKVSGGIDQAAGE
jgi:Flp pilus assembly pilin Flp